MNTMTMDKPHAAKPGSSSRMLRFTKMHGLGNDYVYVNCFDQDVAGIDLPALSRTVSDRFRGIGSDGLILICKPRQGVDADVRMEMYNSDGSRSEMCGNGIRCVANYAMTHGLVRDSRAKPGDGKTTVLIDSDGGVKTASIDQADPSMVTIDMGPPILVPREIPVATPGDRCIKHDIQVDGRSLKMTCVSMGNPHAVFFLESLDGIVLQEFGPQVEHHSLFPNRVNAHIARVHSPREVTMKTWERGAGTTMACGTGACAVLVAGVLEGRLDRKATLHLPGGDLTIEWTPESGAKPSHVLMTGPAVEVFDGEWKL